MASKAQTERLRNRKRRRRHRIRKLVSGTGERPRMVVHRGISNIEVQIVDDTAGHSVVGMSTRGRELRDRKFDSRRAQGHEIGKLIAAKALDKGISKVVFDRGGFLFHGIVKAVADGARDGGLKF